MRRKADRECIIGDTYVDLKSTITPCECTAADFDCGEYHVQEGDKCVLAPNVVLPEPVCVNGFMTGFPAYRKMKISQCVGGLDFEEATVSCGGIVYVDF